MLKVIYGNELPSLTVDELLDYYEKLTVAIQTGWKHEGRYVLRDIVRYEIKKRCKQEG